MNSAPPRRLRLLQMMLSTQNGGAETFFEKLALAFTTAGVDQCLVIEPHPERERLFAGQPNLQVQPVRYRGFHELFGRWRTRRIVQEFQPDLILAWMNRAVKRAPRGFCPVLARYGGYYKVDRCRDCDMVIGNTPDIVRYLREHGLSAAQTTCIPNFAELIGSETIGPEVRSAVRAELGLSPSVTVLLAVGRLHPNKAQDTLLRAVARVPGVMLLLAGDGPQRTELEQLAAEMKITDRVRFLGWRRDVARLYAAADLAVFPSRFEPYGNVVVECWVQRVPLIAAAAVGPKLLVDDGVNGRLFPVDDVAALVAAIQELERNPELRARFVENGYRKYREQFSREVIVAQYQQLFARVLEGRGGPGRR